MPYCQACQEDKYIVFLFPFSIEKEKVLVEHSTIMENDAICYECLERMERNDDNEDNDDNDL